jgi:hypothetical protein
MDSRPPRERRDCADEVLMQLRGKIRFGTGALALFSFVITVFCHTGQRPTALFEFRNRIVIGGLDFSPGFFRASFDGFPCLIAGGLQLLQLRLGLILFVLQGLNGFVGIDLRVCLGILRLGLEKSNLRVPFLQLCIELLFIRFSFVRDGNLLLIKNSVSHQPSLFFLRHLF